MPLGQGPGDLHEVVDDQAVDQPLPARGARHVRQQLDALGVPEQRLYGRTGGVHRDQGVLEMRLQDDPVGVERGQRGRHDLRQVRLPPGRGIGRRGERAAVEALGETRGEERHGARQQMVAQPVADHHGQFLVREGRGAMAPVGQPRGGHARRGGRPHRGEGAPRGGVRAAQPKQVVAPEPADVVGDPHVQAELQEQVGPRLVHRTDRGGRPGVEGVVPSRTRRPSAKAGARVSATRSSCQGWAGSSR